MSMNHAQRHVHDRVQSQPSSAEQHLEGHLVAAQADQALAPQLLFLYLYHVRLHRTLHKISKVKLTHYIIQS